MLAADTRDNIKIFVLDICPDISNLSSLLSQKIVDQDLSEIKKIIFILPISICTEPSQIYNQSL